MNFNTFKKLNINQFLTEIKTGKTGKIKVIYIGSSLETSEIHVDGCKSIFPEDFEVSKLEVKPKNWRQDNPQDQLVACLSGIIGMASNVEQFSVAPQDIERGTYIREQAEQLLKLKPWVKENW